MDAFRLSAILGIGMGLYCLTLPATPPAKEKKNQHIQNLLPRPQIEANGGISQFKRRQNPGVEIFADLHTHCTSLVNPPLYFPHSEE